MYTARIDSVHAYKQSGSTSGFNGARRLELRDPAPPAGQSLVDNLLGQRRYEQRNPSQIGYSARIGAKVASSCRSMASSARLAHGINEAVARCSQTAVQGRFIEQTTTGIREFLTPCKIPEQLLLDWNDSQTWNTAHRELRTHKYKFPSGSTPRAARVGRRLLLREGNRNAPYTVPRIA